MNDEEKIKFKQLLKSICVDVLKKRVEAAEFVMMQAQDSANSDEKSSAGDKHETGRAMDQMERDMNAVQANKAKRELQLAEAVKTDKINDSFFIGSVAVSEGKYYFMCSGLGSAEIDHKKIFLLSPQAPLSMALFQKKAGDTIIFNDKKISLSEVF